MVCQNNKMVNKLIQKTEWKTNYLVFKYNFFIKPEQNLKLMCVYVSEKEKEKYRGRDTQR